MRPFTLHVPTELLFGAKAFSRLCRRMSVHGVGRVLLLAGTASAKQSGAYDAIAASLEKQAIAWTELWGVASNPDLAMVRQAAHVLQEHRCSAVLALGGGSVIDCAKAAAVAVHDDPAELLRSGKHATRALPVYAASTLAGSGSEVNGDAVLTDSDQGYKTSLRGPALYPRASAVDPKFHAFAPWEIAGPGAVDVFSHVLEHYLLGRRERTSLAVNEALMRSALDAGDCILADPDNVSARSDLAWASILAQNGVASAGLGGGEWTAHLLAHAAAARRPELSHGRALAAIVPVWLQWLRRAENPPILEQLERNVIGLDALRERWRQWGMPASLRQCGLEPDDAASMTAQVMAHGRAGRLRRLRREEVYELLLLALQ